MATLASYGLNNNLFAEKESAISCGPGVRRSPMQGYAIAEFLVTLVQLLTVG
jgi:hypothetical protein